MTARHDRRTAQALAGFQSSGYAADPVGTVEIADRMGVTRSAVDHWRQRPLGFPAPRWTVGGRPAWEWGDVAAWAERTGRR